MGKKLKEFIKTGDIEIILCDGVSYMANTQKGEEFLKKNGLPHFCCGYHGWTFLFKGGDK